MHVVGTYKEFKKALKNKTISDKVCKAIKIYLDTGGVIKIRKKGKLKILYPSKNRLNKNMEKTEKKEKYLETQLSFWRKERDKMNTNEMLAGFKKVTNVNYWKHLMQLATDNEYRKSFAVVDPPMDLMHEGRYKKVIDMFIKNAEYRERLVEARTSILGKMRSSIKETAYKSQEFKRETIELRIKRLEKEKSIHTKKKNAIKVLIDNSSTFF